MNFGNLCRCSEARLSKTEMVSTYSPQRNGICDPESATIPGIVDGGAARVCLELEAVSEKEN